MNCNEAKKYMHHYIGSENEENKEEFIKHIRECKKCAEDYELQKSIDSKLSKTFNEKQMPEGFEEKLIESIPEVSKKSHKKVSFFTGRFKVLTGLAVAASLIFALVIPLGGRSIIERILNTGSLYSESKADLAVIIRLNNIDYLGGGYIITDDRIIGEQIGVTKISITSKNSNQSLQEGAATMLPVGTPIYSVKGMEKEKAIAAKYEGRWVLYRAMGTDGLQPLYNPEFLKAKKIIVSYDLGKGQIKREITDRDTINKLADYLKNPLPLEGYKAYGSNRGAMFYFYIEDEAGIGKPAHPLYVGFNDPYLGGSLSYDKEYKMPPEILQLLIPENIENGYDRGLGGSRQIYEILAGGKLIIRKYSKNDNVPPVETKFINQGEKLIRDGMMAEDNLKGNYKLMITMKNTTIQDKALKQLLADYVHIPGAVSAEITKGLEKDTTIIYIGFDKIPDYVTDDSSEVFVIVFGVKAPEK